MYYIIYYLPWGCKMDWDCNTVFYPFKVMVFSDAACVFLLSIFGSRATAAEECKMILIVTAISEAGLFIRGCQHHCCWDISHQLCTHIQSAHTDAHAQRSLCHLWPLRNIHADLTVLRKTQEGKSSKVQWLRGSYFTVWNNNSNALPFWPHIVVYSTF